MTIERMIELLTDMCLMSDEMSKDFPIMEKE